MGKVQIQLHVFHLQNDSRVGSRENGMLVSHSRKGIGAVNEQTINGGCSQNTVANLNSFTGTHSGKGTTALSSCASNSGRSKDFCVRPAKVQVPDSLVHSGYPGQATVLCMPLPCTLLHSPPPMN